MKDIEIGSYHQWDLGALFDSTSPFLRINADTVLHTWVTLLLIALLIICIRVAFRFKDGKIRFAILTFIDYFMDLTEKTLGTFNFRHFSFVTGLFTFILVCNYSSLIPWIEEPTKDLNTTLSLGILSFIYIQAHAIKAQGIGAYIKEYFEPFFLMLPLNVVGKLANIISISFRLYGNIFGGSIIFAIYLSFIKGSVVWETFGILSGITLALTSFFVFFEGILQAFVFSMLTLTYLSIAIQHKE